MKNNSKSFEAHSAATVKSFCSQQNPKIVSSFKNRLPGR